MAELVWYMAHGLTPAAAADYLLDRAGVRDQWPRAELLDALGA